MIAPPGGTPANDAEDVARKVWEMLVKSNQIPKDVPARPDLVYADQWNGWVDWLNWGGAK